MSKLIPVLPASLCLSLLAPAAHAHPGDHGSGGLAATVLHLLGEPDHLALLAAAVVAGVLLLRRRAAGRRRGD